RYFETDDDCVCVEVQDTGIGIESEDIDKAFQPFVRLKHGSLPTAAQGTGIGLTITKQLTELMGGTIEVASPASGGTCMTVTFPRSFDKFSQIRATGT
ncbi:MAG: HAMP domain-containing histidine kinase, partial [Gammaproteobacteria bacterium]|nr:HAMP domain-containing histidine kinase [Gammaproteobacteria bacterium]